MRPPGSGTTHLTASPLLRVTHTPDTRFTPRDHLDDRVRSQDPIPILRRITCHLNGNPARGTRYSCETRSRPDLRSSGFRGASRGGPRAPLRHVPGGRVHRRRVQSQRNTHPVWSKSEQERAGSRGRACPPTHFALQGQTIFIVRRKRSQPWKSAPQRWAHSASDEILDPPVQV